MVQGNAVRMKRLQWLWPGRIPLGKITSFAGLPGEGKSLVTCALAAAVTSQRSFPDGSANPLSEPCDVLFISSEDDLEDTMTPRLTAAGADLSRVHFVKSVFQNPGESNQSEQMVALDEDLPGLHKFIEEHPAIRLVVIDPITNHLGKVKMIDEQQVRSVLAPLEFPNVAVVVVLHLNKKEGLNAIQRVSGAGAFVGAARASWLFAVDPQNANLQHMLPLKNNHASKSVKGLQFEIQTKAVTIDGTDEDVPHVVWLGQSERTADQMFEAQTQDSRVVRAEAEGFLRKFLADGSKPMKEVQEAAQAQCISERALRRAKKALDIESHKDGKSDGPWIWELPPSVDDAIPVFDPGQSI